MSDLISVVKLSLIKAKDNGIDVYIPPNDLFGHLYEFGITNNKGDNIIIAIHKDGSESFAYGKTLTNNNVSLEAGNYDKEATNALVLHVVTYLATC